MEGLEEIDFVNARQQRSLHQARMPHERSMFARWMLFAFVVTTLATTIAMLGLAAFELR